MQQYANIDGTYTSPRNGKVYKSEKAFRAHWFHKSSSSQNNWQEINKRKVDCKFCKKEIGITNILKHEDACYLNPKNTILCLSCNSPIEDYRNSKGTCSHSCSNKYFRKLRNKPENYSQYTTICWEHHEKKCVVCGEERIVAVHHYDENHNNDLPENLVPLCPTHHQYVHSRYRDEVIGIVDKYVVQFRNKQGLV